MNEVSEEDALQFLSPYVGKEINRSWRGQGSAIFLEVGNLVEGKGELTIMIEWSWRVESEKSITFGSWSEEEAISNGLRSLEGKKVEGFSFYSRLPELMVQLSNNYWVCSFSTIEGSPEWSLIAKNKTLQSIEGRLAYES
jgi:hypothetical protein